MTKAIQRWGGSWDGGCEKSDDGEYVLYDDHLAALSEFDALTAWQPIETAPLLEEGALGPWVQVWGVRFGRSAPAVHLARRDAQGWGDRDGNSIRPTLWAPAMKPPTDAPEVTR